MELETQRFRNPEAYKLKELETQRPKNPETYKHLHLPNSDI